ncbi:MAG: D-glycero-beta-D-manno-heptose-7-phosphate kinase [Chitinophagales bacterium]|nr:D-glycero-beta-D-manno-heptose-7-phosphate kinase [Chitinophagales bacterium]
MMLDSYIYGNVDRISPEAPVPVVLVEKRENRPGGAANVAMNIQSMGAVPLLVSVAGNDTEGKALVQLLDENNIASAYIINDPDRITTTKTRIISMHNQMLRLDNETLDEVPEAVSDLILLRATEIIETEDPDILIFEDYNKGVLTEKLIREITMLCLQKNIPVAVDPKKKNFFAYQLCTLFKPNLREIQESLHLFIDTNNIETINAAAAALQKKLHHGISLITLSDKGIYIRSNKDILQKPAHVRNVSDVSGAGDTVISIAALCLAAKTSLDTIASLSNIAGGIVCEYPGVVPIDKKRLLDEALELM